MGTPAIKSAPKRLTGSKLGKYTLKEPLGQGAFGEVYAAEPKDGANVAIKILDAAHARDEDAVERFKREGETAKRLAHPNIVRVLDVGSSRSRHYLVMEIVRGGSLERAMRRDGSAERVLSALAEAARALAYAHGEGVVHRDVKPANILLTKAGKAKVTDFGLARTVDHSSMTTEGRLLGTASYMSPEQVKGERAGAASDVYAMGVMIYEAIAGELPFKSDTQIGYLYQHAELDPPRPSVRPPYPPALAELALACLAKNPKDRPTMARVAERLARTSLVRPRRWTWLVVVLIAAALAAAAALWLMGCNGGGTAKPATPVATIDAAPAPAPVATASVDAAPMTWRGPNLYTLDDGDVTVGFALRPPGTWTEDWTDEHERLTSAAGSAMEVTFAKGDPPADTGTGTGTNAVVIHHAVAFPAGAWHVRCAVTIVDADRELLAELVRQCTELEMQQEPDPRLAWTITVKPAKVTAAKINTVTVRYTVTNKGTAPIDAKSQNLDYWVDGASSMTLGMAFGNGGFDSIWMKLPPGKTVDDERTGMDDLVAGAGDHVISLRHLDHEVARATLHVTK